MTPREDVTMIPCERCSAMGSRREVSETATTYRVTGEAECWCCGGAGICTLETSRAWICAGRPDSKPEGWTL